MLHAQICRMVEAMAWADDQVLAMLRDCPASHAEALPLLGHVLAAEHVWLARLEQRAAAHPAWPELTFAEAEQLARRNAAGYAAYLHARDEADLGRPVAYRSSLGDEYLMPAVDLLTHVVTHGAYHRGQIATVLKRHGVQAASTDYIKFASASR